jgi:alkaline phosphatase D
MHYHKRRSFFKRFILSLASLSYSFSGLGKVFSSKEAERPLPASRHEFSGVNDRVWLGEKYWAIPMEDWAVKDERIEFYGTEKNSRVNVLTSVLKEGNGNFEITADMGLMKTRSKKAVWGTAGFSIGVLDKLDPDVKSACFFGNGTPVGISIEGFIFAGHQRKPLPKDFNYDDFNLSLKCRREDRSTEMVLVCRTPGSGATELTYQVSHDVPGLVALVNNVDREDGASFWFRNLRIEGTKISNKPENSFGPILWAMYTLSKGTLKLTAQMPPLGDKDSDEVALYLKRDNKWQLAATAKIDETACTAIFELRDSNAASDVPYELVYLNNNQEHKYPGTIRREPTGRPLRFGGLTCQHAAGFPYTPLVKNLTKHDPDILYFSGDQLYESNGGYPIKREPIPASILSYLGKWYMFGWAFGQIMRDRPTICTPDDHDVFHGNLWGESGDPIPMSVWNTSRDAHGGYVQSPAMVNAVARTQCGHLPDPYHTQPLPSGLNTWYTHLVYGGVSFAIISDRMFKSGPDKIRTAEGRKDHIRQPLVKGELERTDLELLGEGQMQFLNDWVQDWQGAYMKVLLSQTLFCNVGTHHGGDKMFLYGDMDSGGWPKQKRDEALRVIRKASAFHINGDQHLPFVVQYSLDEVRDGGWTFCTPAISTGYVRWGEPDAVKASYTDRPAHGLPNTGVYHDIFGNVNYIYAVGNPKDKFTNKNRYIQAQNKSSGFGMIIFDTQARTIRMEAYRFLADKDNPTADDQFPGWPLTVDQMDNDGRRPIGYLPRVKVNKADQVIKIIDEKNQELISVLRVRGSSFIPRIFRKGTYSLVIGEGSDVQEVKGLKSSAKIPRRVISISY